MTMTASSELTTNSGDVLASTVSETTTTTSATTVTFGVDIAKREILGGQPTGNEVIGAYLQVKNENGIVIESWQSDGTVHRVTGLEEGVTYILEEVAPPNGYYYAESIKFQLIDGVSYIVNENGSLSDAGGTIVMFDEVIVTTTATTIITTTTTVFEDTGTDISETTVETTTVSRPVIHSVNVFKMELINGQATGMLVPGAVLQIHEGENTICEWTSGGGAFAVDGLSENVIYKLVEAKAPTGYLKADSIEFTIIDSVVYVIDNGSYIPQSGMEITMLDEREPIATTSSSTTTETTTTTTTTTASESATTDTETSASESSITSSHTGTTTATTKKTTTYRGGGGRTSPGVSSSPKTGDSTKMIIPVLTSVLVLGSAAAVSRKKKR